MTERGRAALILLGILGLAAMWRTGVRAGERDSRIRSPIGADRTRPLGVDATDAARHLETRVEDVRRRLAERPREARLHLRLANLCYQRAYSRALEAYAADPAAARRLEEGDDRHYREWMRKALERDPSGDLRAAARAARAGLAFERNPGRRWELLRSLARTECARGAHDRELQALEEGQSLRPDDPEVLTRLAHAYGEIGDPLAVEETLEQAWRAARRRGAGSVSAPESAPGATGRADSRWASSALDGDEWLSGLYLRSP